MTQLGADSKHPLIAVHGDVVRALHRDTGRQLWEYKAERNIARLALANARVFVLDEACQLSCIDAASGSIVGVMRIDGVEWTGCALVAEGDMVYAASTRTVAAIDETGKVLWRTEVGAAVSALAGLALPGNIVQPDFNS